MNAAAAQITPLTGVVSPVAIERGQAMAKRLFDGRKGHGESSRVVERHLSEAEVAALCAIAYDAGRGAAKPLATALRECMDYLSCIPESAAGGDDAAGQICKRARAALTAAGIE
jgi:hypothetical protein